MCATDHDRAHGFESKMTRRQIQTNIYSQYIYIYIYAQHHDFEAFDSPHVLSMFSTCLSVFSSSHTSTIEECVGKPSHNSPYDLRQNAIALCRERILSRHGAVALECNVE